MYKVKVIRESTLPVRVENIKKFYKEQDDFVEAAEKRLIKEGGEILVNSAGHDALDWNHPDNIKAIQEYYAEFDALTNSLKDKYGSVDYIPYPNNPAAGMAILKQFGCLYTVNATEGIDGGEDLVIILLDTSGRLT